MNQLLSSSLRRVPRLLATTILLIMAAQVAPVPSASASAGQQEADVGLLVYHQITNLDDPIGVGSPVLSADGTRAVFSNVAGSADPEAPNRIFVINADGTGLTEVDSYRPLCGCGAHLDITPDGSTVVSTDSMQVRVAGDGGARELLKLGSNEITAIRLSADAETVYILVRRDVGTADGSTTLERGVWAIDVDSGELSPLATATDIATIFDIPADQYGCCLHGDGKLLDVSDEGRVVFGAYGTGGEYVFGVESSNLVITQIAGPFAYLKNTAISADGSTVAYDAIKDPSGNNQVDVTGYAGGATRTVATATASSFSDYLRLSADGSKLLITPNGFLVDTASGSMRQLAVQTPGASPHTDLLFEGMVRASMNEDATRFLYVMRFPRCADCANLPEQLATLDLDPADLGDAPAITDAAIDPDEIIFDYGTMATATATIDTEAEVLFAGVVALRDGVHDINVADNARLADDGLNGDTRANDGVYTFASIFHAYYVAREDDIGPRTLRAQVEVETPDGLRHATALDFGTLMVIGTRV